MFAEHAQTMTDIPEVKEFYAMAEKALRTQNQVNWMSVKDGLPTKKDSTSEMVLAIENDKERRVKPWHWKIVRKYATEFTHWMPLPEPPERDDE